MKKQYSSSLYSQKSTTSAKSGKSFLSLSTAIWPSSKKRNASIEEEEEEEKNSVWDNLKRLLALKKSGIRKDNDSITTRSINTTSSTSSVSKLKQLLFLSPNQTFQVQPNKVKANNASTPPPSYYATLNEIDMAIDHFPPEKPNTSQNKGPAGILINRGEDSAEAIEERKKRRHKRREYILKLQQRNHGFRRHFYPSSDSRIDPAIDYHHRHILFEEEKVPPESSSSDTLVTNESPDTVGRRDDREHKIKPRVGFQDEQNDDDDKYEWEFNPRIMFIEPSPVPRFRNAAPPPPPSPPYMNIIVDQADLDDHDSTSRRSGYLSIIESPTIENDQPTIFAPKDILSQNKSNLFDDEEDRRMSLLMESLRPRPIKKPHLYFYSPYQRGQTIKFTLQNIIPEDHIILFKFLTSNATKQQQKGSKNGNVTNSTSQPERYFVRPSAGRMVSADQTDIMLFLNQVPTLRPGELLKDKILVRWAVIQKNTRIEEWVKSLSQVTRKKWIDMLAEQWPNQVTIQMTKIKIHFNPDQGPAKKSLVKLSCFGK
ncbi:hypothetical protein K501DRAFT_323589 [Backusella circina FSU 941]|nr:hypothetical protein K501DRAFT_323589 [Backusella circina FSU 941]